LGFPHLRRSLFHRFQDAVMAAAAAEIVVERLRDLGPCRRRIAVEQRLGRDQDAGQAIAALPGLQVEEGLLQRMWPGCAAEPLDGCDVLAGDAPDWLTAGFLRLTVDQHHAAAALFQPAAEARAHKAEIIAQHSQERRLLVVERKADRLAVDGEVEILRHGLDTELFAQDTFVEIVSGIEQHVERNGAIHTNSDFVHRSHFVAVGDGSDRALVAIEHFERDLGLVGQ